MEAVSSMWASSAPGSKVCRPDARSGVHWNFHTGVAEDGFVIDRWVEMMDFFVFWMSLQSLSQQFSGYKNRWASGTGMFCKKIYCYRDTPH